MPTFSPEALEQFASRLFVAAGVPAGHAGLVARSLVDSNLCGHDSHGVIRVPQYMGFLREGKLSRDSRSTVIRETPAMLSIDGQWGLGQVQAFDLLERLWAKAEILGIASGTLRRTGHIGRLGEYAEWAAARGGALFATARSASPSKKASQCRRAGSKIPGASRPPTRPTSMPTRPVRFSRSAAINHTKASVSG